MHALLMFLMFLAIFKVIASPSPLNAAFDAVASILLFAVTITLLIFIFALAFGIFLTHPVTLLFLLIFFLLI